MVIKFKRLSDKAIAPVKAHATDAGFDITCIGASTEISECGQVNLVYHTGLAVEIPEGYFGALVPRSSVSMKSLDLANCIGVIDAGYRGEIMAKFRPTVDVIPAVYKEGERIAQLLILPVLDVQFEESDELSESDRGEGGFGSTNIDESAATPLQQQDSVIDAKDDQTSAEAVSASEQAAEPINDSEEAQ